MMGRQVRRVAKDWQHPRDDSGRYLPLFDGVKFSEQVACWDEGVQKWGEGFRLDFNDAWIPLDEDQIGQPYSSWAGERPDPKKYMPLWRDEERTHLMMYENTSEGTPISPAFCTAEELARWLAGDNASSPSYDAWLSIIKNQIVGVPSDQRSLIHELQAARSPRENQEIKELIDQAPPKGLEDVPVRDREFLRPSSSPKPM